MKPIILNNNTKGIINFTKSILHSISNLVLISPISLQLFLTICSYVDDNGSLITNKKTLAHLIKTEIRKIDYCLDVLQKHNLIFIKKVNIHYTKDIFGKIHDKKNYYLSNKKEWNVIGEKLLHTIKIKGTYTRIYINKDLVSLTNGYYNTLLLHIKNNLYYNTRLLNTQIIEER